MTEDTRRRIVAILFSDIVGYTAAMGEDEELAIRAVSRSRAIQKELVRRFNGQWVQEVGDGALCTFDSAVEAVNCALEIQRAFHADPDFSLRIGIHVGDIVFRKTEVGYDVFGDGVNVASRVQGVAEPGGIGISERVFDDLRNRKDIDVTFVGEKQLKNVNRPIRVYAVIDRDGPAPAAPAESARAAAPGAAARSRLLPTAALAAVLVAGVLVTLLWPRAAEPPPLAEPAAPRAAAPRPAGEERAPAEASAERAKPSLEQAPPTPVAPGSFAAVRKTLLGAVGTWAEARPRVWTEPDPVPDRATYRVRFEANCECSALLFAVDDSGDDIVLLYPNPYEPVRRLAPGEVLEIPSSDAYQLRAVGGQGMDLLKLLVTREAIDFPAVAFQSWAATPHAPERVAELEQLLDGLDGHDWAAAVTPLHIAK
jgi:class 3 adenylate cyclase